MMKKISKLFALTFAFILALSPVLKTQAAEPEVGNASNRAITYLVGSFDASQYVELLNLNSQAAKPRASVTTASFSNGTVTNINTSYVFSADGKLIAKGNDAVPADGILCENCTYDKQGNVTRRTVTSADSTYTQDIKYTYGKYNEIDCQYIAIKADGSNLYYKYDADGRITSFDMPSSKVSHFTKFTYENGQIKKVNAYNGLRTVDFSLDAAGRIVGYQAAYSDLGFKETAGYTYNEAGILLASSLTRTSGTASTTYVTVYLY